MTKLRDIVFFNTEFNVLVGNEKTKENCELSQWDLMEVLDFAIESGLKISEIQEYLYAKWNELEREGEVK